MALLAAYLLNREETLEEFLDNQVFKSVEKTTIYPDAKRQEGINRYLADYKKLLAVEKLAVSLL